MAALDRAGEAAQQAVQVVHWAAQGSATEWTSERRAARAAEVDAASLSPRATAAFWRSHAERAFSTQSASHQLDAVATFSRSSSFSSSLTPLDPSVPPAVGSHWQRSIRQPTSETGCHYLASSPCLTSSFSFAMQSESESDSNHDSEQCTAAGTAGAESSFSASCTMGGVLSIGGERYPGGIGEGHPHMPPPPPPRRIREKEMRPADCPLPKQGGKRIKVDEGIARLEDTLRKFCTATNKPLPSSSTEAHVSQLDWLCRLERASKEMDRAEAELEAEMQAEAARAGQSKSNRPSTESAAPRSSKNERDAHMPYKTDSDANRPPSRNGLPRLFRSSRASIGVFKITSEKMPTPKIIAAATAASRSIIPPGRLRRMSSFKT